jgi:very-short-patch-repair endonuclease
VAADVVHYARDRQRPASELAGKLAELRASVTLLERLALGEPAAGRGPTALERWLFAALDDAGVVYERFAPVGRYIPDAVLPGYMVIIEVDGVIWHRKREAYGRQRDADLMAAGYTVVHLTDLEMTSQGKARALIAEVLASIRDGRQGYRPPMLWP